MPIMAAEKPSHDYDVLLKLLMIGDSGVGKSTLLLRYTDDFYREDPEPTIGVDFRIRSERIDGKAVRMQIWDTAGQERFRGITSSYYRGSHGFVVCYDVTDRQSFEHVHMWLKEIERYSGGCCGRLLVGTKCDLASERRVSREEGQELAAGLGLRFMETSAKNLHNVDSAFGAIFREALEHSVKRELPRANEVLSLDDRSPNVGAGRGADTRRSCCEA